MKRAILDFRVHAAILDNTVRRALFLPASRAPSFATQNDAQVTDSNAAQGNSHDMEAPSANLV